MNDLDFAGYAIADLTLADDQCGHIAASLPPLSAVRGGVRNLISHPTVERLLMHQTLGAYLWSLVGRDLVAVKATLFDKTAESNWRLQWHQDRAITVKERLDLAGYGPWRMKAGSLYVEPPAEVLMQMLAVRIHVDGCDAENSPLRVIPGSHQSGVLSEEKLREVVRRRPSVELSVARGAIVVMRPLLVHAASPAPPGVHRRVLHIEFAPLESISPLRWHTAVHLRRAA